MSSKGRAEGGPRGALHTWALNKTFLLLRNKTKIGLDAIQAQTFQYIGWDKQIEFSEEMHTHLKYS